MADQSAGTSAPIIAAIPAQYGEAVSFITDVPLEFPNFFLTCTAREFQQTGGEETASVALNFRVSQVGKHLLTLDVKARAAAVAPVEFTVDGKVYQLYSSAMPGKKGEALYPHKLAVFEKR